MIRFRVELLDIRPPVWRRIEVRADATLWALHVALQNAMGWTDSHLHEFELPSSDTGNATWIGMPDPEGDDDREILPTYDVPATSARIPFFRAAYNSSNGSRGRGRGERP